PKTFYNQASPVDSSAVEAAPCKANMVDVKLTETNLPWYFRVAHEVLTGVPFINAHARVEILQESIVHGAEPLAIAESAPVAVKAFYVDEDKANEVLASAPLTNTGPNGRGQEIWSDEATPVAVEVKKTTPHIGVIVALSGK